MGKICKLINSSYPCFWRKNKQKPMLLDGKKVAKSIHEEIAQEIHWLTHKPCLGAILLGDTDSPSMRYIRQKQRSAKEVGIDFHLYQLPINTPESTLLSTIDELNNDTSISWYIIQLPLPKHIDTQKVLSLIDPLKDVDGFHPINQGKIIMWDTTGFAPCTPAGIIALLEHKRIEISGKYVVILGKSNIVGKPLIGLLLNKWATITSCNSSTPDISVYTKSADILISATGIPHIVSSDMIGKDTVVIDVWFSIIDGLVTGDTDVDAIDAKWNLVTPVPGWVGPMTVAMLLKNTLKAHIWWNNKENL